MHKLVIKAVIAASAIPISGLASAASPNTTAFNVTATVAANCIINSASDLAFGTYTPGAGDVPGTSAITVRCTNGTTYGIGLSTGNSNSTTTRTMTNAASTSSKVNYDLYTDSGHQTQWLNPTNPGAVAGNVGGTGTGMANTFTHTVYGLLKDDATSGAAVPGSYTDRITVTVNY